MIQKVKDEAWFDETGKRVPVIYITPTTRLRERNAGAILKGAKDINKRLEAFKKHVTALCDEIYNRAMEEMKITGRKVGSKNFVFHSFDRSVKIEISVNEGIDFDDLTIQAAKQKLDEFLSENLDSKTEFVKDLVTEAFSTSRGKLDSRKVLSLNKYRNKIMHPLFQQALDLLGESIRRPDSKTYFRIWERQENGEYKLIDLNFSSI